MNTSAPYRFGQPPDPRLVRTLADAHAAGAVAGGSLCAVVKSLRAQLRDGRRWLYNARHRDDGVSLTYRTALLQDLARASAQLAECEAAIDLVIAGLPAITAHRCPTCHHGYFCGRLGPGLVMLAHSKGSMRCSGTGEILTENGVLRRRAS